MERRASSTDEIAELVYENRPEGARGFYVDYRLPSGAIERQPPEGSWTLRPIRTIYGIYEGLLHVHYVDQQGYYMKPASPEQRLVINFVYDPAGRGTAPSPAMQDFSAFADKLNAPLLETRPAEEEEDAPEVEEIEAMQGVQKRQLHLLTMDSLQNFLRDSLSHFVRLQETATKGSQAQIEASIHNMKLLSEQSTKMLEAQIAASQLAKERMEELQPTQAAPSFDVVGLLGTVLPFVQNMWGAAPPRGGLAGHGSSSRLGSRRQPAEEGDLLDMESVGATAAGQDRATAAVGVVREMAEPENLARLVTDRAYLESYLERLRTAATAAKTGAASRAGSATSAPSASPPTPAPPWGPRATGPDPPWQSEEEGVPSLSALIAEVTRTSRA